MLFFKKIAEGVGVRHRTYSGDKLYLKMKMWHGGASRVAAGSHDCPLFYITPIRTLNAVFFSDSSAYKDRSGG